MPQTASGMVNGVIPGGHGARFGLTLPAESLLRTHYPEEYGSTPTGCSTGRVRIY